MKPREMEDPGRKKQIRKSRRVETEQEEGRQSESKRTT